MKIDQLLVLADPSWPYLRALERLSPRITVTTGLTSLPVPERGST